MASQERRPTPKTSYPASKDASANALPIPELTPVMIRRPRNILSVNFDKSIHVFGQTKNHDDVTVIDNRLWTRNTFDMVLVTIVFL
jgi:hypothetical protein